MIDRMIILAWLVVTVLGGGIVARPAQAGAPPPVGSVVDPHPALPWGWPPDYGEVIRYWPVGAQTVTIEMYIDSGYNSPSPGTYEWRQVTIPGYYVVETTHGWYTPPHWTLRKRGHGVYAWEVVRWSFTYR